MFLGAQVAVPSLVVKCKLEEACDLLSEWPTLFSHVTLAIYRPLSTPMSTAAR